GGNGAKGRAASIQGLSLHEPRAVMFGSFRGWRSGAARARLVKTFLQVFGAGWLLVEPLALWKPQSFEWGTAGYVLLVIVSLFLATVWSWPKTRITRRLAV